MKNKMKRMIAGLLAFFMAVMILEGTTIPANAASNPAITYAVFVQDIGYQNGVRSTSRNIQTAGTVGQGKRLEGICANITNVQGLGVQYRVHMQGAGWGAWCSNGEMAGAAGAGKRMEALQIRLIGEKAKEYKVFYRVHAQSFGWLAWAGNGQLAGTVGLSKRLEAIQIVVVKKGAPAPSKSGQNVARASLGNVAKVPDAGSNLPHVIYDGHVQGIGNVFGVKDGGMLGVSGQSRRLEGISIRLANLAASGYEGSGIRYNAHVQGIGWQGERADGQLAGTAGQSKRLEALSIYLTGKLAQDYHIYYRVHVQNYGWLDWASDGKQTGSEGYGLRIESVQMGLIKKGAPAPGATDKLMISEGDIKYYGWIFRGGKYYYYNKTTGIMQKGGTVVGITLNADGSAVMNEFARQKLPVIFKAKEIVNQICSPDDSLAVKMRKCYNYVADMPYMLKMFPVKNYKDTYACVDAVYANNLLNAYGDQSKCGGECVAEAAALGYLYDALGVPNVVLCSDTSHGWIKANGRYFDPLFVEAKGEQYYDATSYPLHTVLSWSIN